VDESRASPEAREKLRKLREQPRTYQVGYSPAMEHKLAELTGIEIPKNETQKAKKIRAEAQRLLAKQQELIKKSAANPEVRYLDYTPLTYIWQQIEKSHPGAQRPQSLQGLIPLLPALDWGDFGIGASGVSNQGECNSCWAFATIAAYESSLQFQYKKTDLARSNRVKPGVWLSLPPAVWAVKLSEQELLNCVGKQKGDCGGGWHGSAFSYIVSFGADEISGQYTPQKGACLQRGGSYKALTWDYVNYPPDQTPSVGQLKLALLEHGPLVVLVHVDDAFLGYKEGVFNERDPGGVNHAVLLTGWDDGKHAWRIQNSWGEQWGEKGFMWIDWESNNVGQYAAWIDAPLSYFDKPLTDEPAKKGVR
jgi:cathepsin L